MTSVPPVARTMRTRLTPTAETAARQIAAGIAAGCRLNRRGQAPSTGQLLLALEAGEA